MSDFIADKTAEARDALHDGDGQRAAQIITETVLESGTTFEQTISQMTEQARHT
jgi:hypothetical protein